MWVAELYLRDVLSPLVFSGLELDKDASRLCDKDSQKDSLGDMTFCSTQLYSFFLNKCFPLHWNYLTFTTTLVTLASFTFTAIGAFAITTMGPPPLLQFYLVLKPIQIRVYISISANTTTATTTTANASVTPQQPLLPLYFYHHLLAA